MIVPPDAKSYCNCGRSLVRIYALIASPTSSRLYVKKLHAIAYPIPWFGKQNKPGKIAGKVDGSISSLVKFGIQSTFSLFSPYNIPSSTRGESFASV